MTHEADILSNAVHDGVEEPAASLPQPGAPPPSATAMNPARPAIVTAAEWNSALAAMATKEEALADARTALAEERRRMPMTRVEKDYRFIGPKGTVGLAELFAGRRQLILY